MKVIYVDMEACAWKVMGERLPQIVPGAELHCFDSPAPALTYARTQGCDVLLTEVELWPERLGGVRLAEAMKEINPRVNIIFITVFSEFEVARALFDLRISGFVPKPWETKDLAAEFQNLRYPVA